MKTTRQLSCTYIDHSRDCLQVKNIYSYNCIRKPNIMQTNIIDCMEFRTEVLKSEAILSLGEPPEFIPCVSLPHSVPESWSGQNNVHFCPSIPLHCRIYYQSYPQEIRHDGEQIQYSFSL